MFNWKKYLGVFFIIVAWLCWLAIPVLPFLGLSIIQIAAITSGLLISSEILNVLGIFFIGKELWKRFRIYPRLKKLFKKIAKK
jgi:hypothetical protein